MSLKGFKPEFANRFFCRVLVGGLLVSLAFGGCTQKRRSPSFSTLRVQLGHDPVSLDPLEAEDGASLRVLSNLMDGLVGYDGGGRLVKRLAKSVKISTDRLFYQFELRDGARWSDGQPVRFEDFLTGFHRTLAPNSPNKFWHVFQEVKGVSEYRAKKAKSISGLTIRDGRLIIELLRPVPYFLKALSLPGAFPIRQDVLDSSSGKWTVGAPSTGPYQMVSYRSNHSILLERNGHYWNYSHPAQIPFVEWMIVSDDVTGVRLFESGRLDVLSRIPMIDEERVEKVGTIYKSPFYATSFLSFNTKKRPFGLPSYRKAVSGAIRRAELVLTLGTGEKPARSFVPEGIEGFLPYRELRFFFWEDMVKIRKRIKEIKLESIESVYDSNHRKQVVMEKIQSDLSRFLGLGLELRNLDWKSFLARLQSDTPALFQFAWMAPFQDPILHLQIFTSNHPNNHTGWASREYDRQIAEIASMEPSPERLNLIQKAQKFLIQEHAIVVPLYHYVQSHAVSSRIQGFRANPYGIIRLEELSFAEKKLAKAR